MSREAVLPERGASLKQRMLRGAVWVLLERFGGQGIRLASNVILARLLPVQAFGLMAIVSAILIGLQMFSDAGIRPSVVQNERGDEEPFLNTAWTIQVLRGSLLWLVAALLAWPTAAYYEEPRFLEILPISGASALLLGFASISLATQLRHLKLKSLSLVQFSARVLAAIVSVVWALVSPTVWALVAGGVTNALAMMIGSYLIRQGLRDRFAWDKAAARSILSFGKWLLLTSALMFLARQADRFILGKITGLEVLGLYFIAAMLTDVPKEVVQILSRRVLFPGLAQMTKLPRPDLRNRILSYRRWMLPLLATGVAVLTVFGDLAVDILYDERFVPAAAMVQLLALGLWPRMLSVTIAPVLLAIGKPQYNAYGSMGRLLIIVVGIPWAHHHFGIYGAVTTIAASDLASYVSNLIGLRRNGLSGAAQDLVFSILLVVLLGLGLAVRPWLGLEAPFDPILERWLSEGLLQG